MSEISETGEDRSGNIERENKEGGMILRMKAL